MSRGTAKVELRGLMQAYSRTIGENTSAGCRAELYDARCKVDPAAFTVTGTIEGVSPDGMTLYDSARTEAGPIAGIAISSVSNSDPGHVTVADGSTLFNGEVVTLAGIVGPDLLNTQTVVRNLSGNVFDLGIDTSDTGVYPAYASGGTVTPLGSGAGYFDYGLMTIDDGDNAGLSREVKSSVPGQWSLELPFPYTILVGAAYTMKAGCDKSVATCKTKFANVVNFRGEPFLPGQDKIFAIGKQK